MHIDLNADLGEGCQYDTELLRLVSSASISCGVHAGNAETIVTALQVAVKCGVRIGAHPSFPDRENFGRREMYLDADALSSHLRYQLGALSALAKAQGAVITYMKPHGALYNQATIDSVLAESIVRLVQEFDPTLAIMGASGGALVRFADAMGMRTISEVFADRAYCPDGTLVPRSDPRAVISDAGEAIIQCMSMVRDGVVRAVDGSLVKVRADTLCLHGDTPDALLFAKALTVALAANDIKISRPP